VVSADRLARFRRTAATALAAAALPLAVAGCMGAPQTHPVMGAPVPVEPPPTMGAVAMPDPAVPPTATPVAKDPPTPAPEAPRP
jgi:hypothetical protein